MSWAYCGCWHSPSSPGRCQFGEGGKPPCSELKSRRILSSPFSALLGYKTRQTSFTAMFAADEPSQPYQRKKTYAKRRRTGCLTCRKRHVRCDEQRPVWWGSSSTPSHGLSRRNIPDPCHRRDLCALRLIRCSRSGRCARLGLDCHYQDRFVVLLNPGTAAAAASSSSTSPELSEWSRPVQREAGGLTENVELEDERASAGSGQIIKVTASPGDAFVGSLPSSLPASSRQLLYSCKLSSHR